MEEESTQVNAPKEYKREQLSCDDIAHIYDILDRFKTHVIKSKPGIARRSDDAMALSALLELMELLKFDFMDDSARHNAIARLPELY